MTQEEKAKAYDEAKLRMSAAYNSNRCTIGFMNEIFPELKEESEDEMIRKSLIDMLKNDEKCYLKEIAWLEKQKAIDVLDEEEREFADNVDSYRKEIDAAYQTGYNEGVKATLENQCEQVYNENLSKLLNKVICRFINDPNIPYSERDEVSKKIIPYVERLEKQGEQPKKHDVCDNCDQQGSCVSPCPMKLVEKQGEQKPIDPMAIMKDYFANTPKEQQEKDWAELKHLNDVGPYIEIPFGAKDSELQEASYHIPEGFHAEIDGNRVVIKRGEQKSAWSEKDDKMLDSIIEEVRYIGDFPDYPTREEDELYDECLAKVKWLKSLRPQSQWKPSDEQMEALWEVYNGGEEQAALASLYSDLKKLREK